MGRCFGIVEIETNHDVAGILHRHVGGVSWQEMPVNKFIQGDTPIPDLTPEAFHYYLPALLLASIDDKNEANADIASSVAFYVSPLSANRGGDDAEGYKHRIALFTSAQRKVLIRVLKEYVARGWETEEEVAETIGALRRS